MGLVLKKEMGAGVDTEKMTSQTPPKGKTQKPPSAGVGEDAGARATVLQAHGFRFHTLDHSSVLVLDCPLYSNPWRNVKYFPNKGKEIRKLKFSELFFIANSLSSFLHTTQTTVIKLYHGHTHFCYNIHLCIYVISHMHVGTKVPQYIPAGQRTMLWSHFSH